MRDYVHTADLAQAHQLAVEALEPGMGRAYNLGSGTGASVLEVLRACEEASAGRSPTRSSAGGPATRPCSSPAPRRSSRNWAGRPATVPSATSSGPPGTGIATIPTAITPPPSSSSPDEARISKSRRRSGRK